MTSTTIAANLHAATNDLSRQVDYRAGVALLNALPVWLILFAVALAMLVFGTQTDTGRIAAWVLVVLVPLGLALALWRSRASAPPHLILAPQGLVLQTRGWGVLAVPWSAIQAIDTRSFDGFALRLRGRQRIAFDAVTLIRLPPGLLEAERAAGHFVPRGPSVDWVVRPGPDGDWIALHHEFSGLTPAEVRTPVEARWTALRETSAPPGSSPLPPLRLGGFRPRHPVLFALGTAVGGVAILIMTANLAGLWETRAQTSTRAWADRWAAEAATSRAEAEARRAREQEFQRMFDRPIFGR